MSDSKCFSRVLCVLCCAVLMPMWRPWNQSSEDEPTLQQTAVHSLEELRAHVSRTLGVGWEDPGFYVYPDPDRRVEDRVRVDSDELLLKWEVKNAIFYAYPRTSKARTPPKDKSGLPLSIRTKRDREEAAELAAMVAARYAPPLQHVGRVVNAQLTATTHCILNHTSWPAEVAFPTHSRSSPLDLIAVVSIVWQLAVLW